MKTPLTLDDLIALNQEVLGLCRAGVPLGDGLRRAASSLGGAAAPLAKRLAERIDSGVPLGDALEAERDQLPGVYLAVVRPALSAGDLLAGLESFATLSARVAEVRRAVWLAVVYPLVLFLIAWGFAVLAVRELLPTYRGLDAQPGDLVPTLQQWLFGPANLAVLVPVAVVLLAAAFWSWTRGARSAGGASSVVRAYGPIARTRRLAGDACFAELLQLLVARETPLPDALRMASDESGSGRLRDASHQAAATIEAGGEPTWEGLPPLVRLALATPAPLPSRQQMLASTAEAYRQRADAWVESVNVFLPTLTVGIGGGLIVVAFALLNFWPYVGALYKLSLPN